MKKIQRVLSFILAAALAVAAVSCDNAGLGEEVDLEAPKLVVNYPNNMDYVARQFEIAGECSDNKKVTRIVIEDQISNKILANAEIYKNTFWTASLSFDKDQEVALRITAYDEAGNSDENSSKVITVIVDTENPVLKSFYLRRNEKYSVNLKDLVTLKNLSLTDSANKDYFQNEFLQFMGALTDNYYLQNIHLELYLENGSLFFDGDVPQNMESVYTPCCEIFQNNLINMDEGPYYVHPVFIAEDRSGNELHVNSLKYFIWYPDYDKPHIIFSLEDSSGSISVPASSEIPLSLFDDDGIEAVYAALFAEDQWKVFENDEAAFENYYDEENDLFNYAGASTVLTDTDCDGVRDLTEIISTAGADAGKYVLVCAVKDRKYDSSTKGVWGKRTIPVTITSSDSPILVIESPVENETASLTEGKKFTVSGYVLDNKTVTTASWAWIPSTDGAVKASDIEKAEKILKGLESSEGSGIVCKSLSLDSAQPLNIRISSTVTKTYYKMPFSQSFDVTADFVKDGVLENETKTFVFYTVDSDGNEVVKTYRLGAYTAEPEVTVNYREYLAGESSVNQSGEMGDMATFNAGSTLKFTVAANGASNLKLASVTGTYGVEGSSELNQINVTGSDLNNEIGFTLADIASDTRYSISLTVTDILGNRTNVIKTVIASTLPELQQFTSCMKSGVILTAGDTLKMQAEFSAAVTINDTANARVQLTNISGVEGPQYARYFSGSGSDTIIFTYEVPQGAFTAGSSKAGCLNKILGQSGDLYSVTDDGTNMLDKTSVIYIDAVAPSIAATVPASNSATISAADNTIKITYSENVVKENGSITIRRKGNWAIPPVLTEEEFISVYNRLSDRNKILMIGTATGEAKLSGTTGQPSGPYVKTTHGLKVTEGEYVPDNSTKYVLRFDLDPHGTDSVVAGLRSAFESVNYHQTEIDVTSSRVTVSGKTVTVKTDAGFFIDGPEYEVLIEKGTFRDSAGNVCAELSAGKYTFYTDKAAVPVIRTERYTHGWGAVEYNAAGTDYVTVGESNLDTKSADTTTAPTGFIRVRIDSLTKDASITYSYTAKSFDGSSVTGSTTQVNGKCYTPEAFDGTNWALTKANSNYSSIFTIGSASLTQAERYFISAKASYSGTSSRPALTASAAGTEGAYKTVIYYEQPKSSGVVFIQGRDIEGGVSITSGFPLRDADPDVRFSKACYEAQDNVWILVSWDFTGSWYIQSYRQNWQNNAEKAPETCSYGMFFYSYNRSYWDAQ